MSSPDHREILVRRALPADIAAIMKLARSAPSAAQWSDAAFLPYCAERESVSASGPRMQTLWVACTFDDSRPRREKIVGFAAFSAVVQAGAVECEMDNIAVLESWRRRGIGRQLLAAGCAWLRNCSRMPSVAEPAIHPGSSDETEPVPHVHPTIWLEVRAGNTDAIAFYRSAGFMIAGRRPSYYSQPTEDAISMRKTL